jgi:transposase
MGCAKNYARTYTGLERALDVTAKGPLALLSRYVSRDPPRRQRPPGRAPAKDPHLRGSDALADRALEAATAELIRELALEALEARAKITRIDRDLEGLLAVHPDGALIRSLPGMGVVLAAKSMATSEASGA